MTFLTAGAATMTSYIQSNTFQLSVIFLTVRFVRIFRARQNSHTRSLFTWLIENLEWNKEFWCTRSNARNHNTILCCTHLDFRRRGSSGRLFGWWLYVLCCKNGLVYPPPTVDQTIIEKIEKLLYFKGLWTKWFF